VWLADISGTKKGDGKVWFHKIFSNIRRWNRVIFKVFANSRTRPFDAVLGTAVRTSSLYINKRHPVLHAKRLETKYRTSDILTIQESTDNVIKVFLPRRYSVVFMDHNIRTINYRTVQYNLTYKGKCFKSQSYILQIYP
jgi:hypothetical protein